MAENLQQPRLPGEWPTAPDASTARVTDHKELYKQSPHAPATHPEPTRGLRPAEARLVATHHGDPHDPEGRPLLHLVVTCPFCDHQHIHWAGHAGQPLLCPRNARCVGGTTGGTYYFPAVQQ